MDLQSLAAATEQNHRAFGFFKPLLAKAHRDPAPATRMHQAQRGSRPDTYPINASRARGGTGSPRGPFLRPGASMRTAFSAFGGAVSCMRGLSSFRGACSFGCSLHRQGTSPECDLRTPLECEARSRGAPCLLAGCELARFAAVGGCVSPCFIVAHIAARLPLIHPVSMEYLLLSGFAD